MQALRTGWDFFQNEVLGMKWLNRLIGSILEACGLDLTSKVGGSIQFFIYDVIKIMVLLGVLILLISYIQSYFPPERTKRILGRFHGIGANCVAALLGKEVRRHHHHRSASDTGDDFLVPGEYHSGKSATHCSDCRAADFADFPDFRHCLYRILCFEVAAQNRRSCWHDRCIQFL